MIRVFAERRGSRCRLLVEGHAGGEEGHDLVCAGVSVLTEALVAFAESRNETRHLRRSVESGRVFLSCRGGLGAAFDLAVFGLRQLAAQYPQNVCVVSAVGC